MSRVVAGGLAVVLLAACGSAPVFDRAEEIHALMEADRDFARATAEQGAEGWAAHFVENGLMFPAGDPIVEGRSAIREAMEPAFSTEGYALTWEPLHAEVAGSGDLGYTYGRYERTVMDERGRSQTSVGKYVTLWRKEPDGRWKVALDIGNEGAPLAPEPPK